MRRNLLALAIGILLLLVTGVGVATASPPAVPAVGQTADSQQPGLAAAGTAQLQPSNENISVRVLSPGDDGSVKQTNDASSKASATNTNAAAQNAAQNGSGTQAAGQSAENEQTAAALSATLQLGASNSNTPVRVLSPGDNGSVEQENEASSDATAANDNSATQTATQDAAAKDPCGCHGSGGVQAAGQKASNEQDAKAVSLTKQDAPSNKNISVRVLSPGDDGDVTQENSASSKATGSNSNETNQTADQHAAAAPCCGSGSQAVGQSAENEQKALAVGLTAQKNPSNSNISVRVLSPGKGGSVKQENSAESDASATNSNTATQSATQDPVGSGGKQVVGQSADNEQKAGSLSATLQKGASNSNSPVRIGSHGDDGSVSQENEASSEATSSNDNTTTQSATQNDAGGSCECDGGSVQAIGQKADNDQHAAAISLTGQVGERSECECDSGVGNLNAPVRVGSRGDGGSVSQENDASSDASATNTNTTTQTAMQDPSGRECGCAGTRVQAIGQKADNEQVAGALGVTLQKGASNVDAPVSVGGKEGEKQSECGCDSSSGAPKEPGKGGDEKSGGEGGSVSQENEASSDASATNANDATQTATQGPADDKCGCEKTGIQALGQEAENEQVAKGLSLTLQGGKPSECGCDGKQRDEDHGSGKSPPSGGDYGSGKSPPSNGDHGSGNASPPDGAWWPSDPGRLERGTGDPGAQGQVMPTAR